MVKETTQPSTSQDVEAQQASQTENNAKQAINSVPLTSTAVLAQEVTSVQLRELEDRLNNKILQNVSSNSKGFLWAVVVVALAAASYSGFLSYQNQNKLNTLESNFAASQGRIDNASDRINNATNLIEQKATLLETAQQNNAQLVAEHSQLKIAYDNVIKSNQEVTNQVNELIDVQKAQLDEVNTFNSKLARFEERNPNDWLISESYFLANNAAQKAIFEHDLKSAVWMLTKADELLTGIEEQAVIDLREAISKDIATLNNIKNVDTRGLGLTLDRAYDNVDELVLIGYNDPAARAKAFEKSADSVTNDIKDWKENLLRSAQDFSSRFIEVRRRDASAVNEFLTPSQDVYVRENIKTRILLAKANLSHGDKEAMQKNISEAIDLVKAYFDAQSKVTVNILEQLNSILSADITIETPKVLESTTAFSKFAKEHLLGRGKN